MTLRLGQLDTLWNQTSLQANTTCTLATNARWVSLIAGEPIGDAT